MRLADIRVDVIDYEYELDTDFLPDLWLELCVALNLIIYGPGNKNGWPTGYE